LELRLYEVSNCIGMGVLMNLTSFDYAHIQHFMTFLILAENEGITDLRVLQEILNRDSAYLRRQEVRRVYKYNKKERGSYLQCGKCGSLAITVPVNTGNGDRIEGGYTHALQCQNRPKGDNPWQPSHCGHTEYFIGASK
jgi:hypothetical protein